SSPGTLAAMYSGWTVPSPACSAACRLKTHRATTIHGSKATDPQLIAPQTTARASQDVRAVLFSRRTTCLAQPAALPAQPPGAAAVSPTAQPRWLPAQPPTSLSPRSHPAESAAAPSGTSAAGSSQSPARSPPIAHLAPRPPNWYAHSRWGTTAKPCPCPLTPSASPPPAPYR